MPKRLVIVEDEALIADHLALLLEDLEYEVVGIFDESDELFAALSTTSVDLILLDINLNAALDGIDIANHLNTNYQIPFVFISSNTDEKTLKRVQHVQPLGFISKPFNIEQLKSSLHLALSAQQKETSGNITEQTDSFFIKDQLNHVRIKYADVLYAKADDNYAQVYTTDKRYVLSTTLKELGQKLPENKFVRCHRSYIVNIEKIERVGGNFILIEETEIPVSESYKKSLMNQLDFL